MARANSRRHLNAKQQQAQGSHADDHDGGSAGQHFEQSAWHIARNPYKSVDLLSADELESLHLASMDILETVGLDFLLPEARAYLKAAGADVRADSERVRIPREMVDQALETVPSSFTLHCNNPEHALPFGGDAMIFSAVASAPNSFDRDGGRRPGHSHDYLNFLRLGQVLNAIDMWGGYPVEPVDWHPRERHLLALQAMVTMTDKAIHGYSLGQERILDAIEIARLARGIDYEQLQNEPSLISIINTSSPLRHDIPMLWGMIELARANQPIVLTPFTLAGAMAPITLAGALAQQNAEALSGLVLTQLVRKGAPFVYGAFTSNVDMKTGAPAFGTPEAMKATLVSGQLARRYRLPLRASNVNAANALDAQAAYESVFSLMSVCMAGVNMVKHAAGWMEGGLQASFEKMLLDADLISMLKEFMRPMGTSVEDFALSAIEEVGPGGHFLGTKHTQARYKDAFYAPLISDWRNFETWQEAGSPTAYDHANAQYKRALACYSPPKSINPDHSAAVEAFVAKRREEGGVPTDF